jgi:hypothetical protein
VFLIATLGRPRMPRMREVARPGFVLGVATDLVVVAAGG